MQNDTQYFVNRPEETRGTNVLGPSSLIPTFGAPTSALDQYRTAGIYSSNLPQLGAAFTDVTSIAALSKVAEGGINSLQELEAAETALQALLLHDVIYVISHAPKVNYGNGLISYHRLDKNARSDLGFELASLAGGHDMLIAPEFVHAEDGVIVSTTFHDSPLKGQRLASLTSSAQYWGINVADAINSAVSEHGIAAYLSDPLLIKARRGDGFAKQFYHRLRISWNKSIEGIPAIECTFNVPPLLAIVLNRLNNRQDLKKILADLREELSDVRAELRSLNNIMTAAVSQQEIQRRVQYINESFDAITAEASVTNAERRQRRLARVQGVARPLIKFMAGFITKTGVEPNDLLSLAPSTSIVMEGGAVVDRTVTARTFSNLIKVEALQSLVKYHLTPAEIAAIEASANR